MGNTQKEIGRFVVAGCLVVVIDSLVYYALLGVLGYILAKTISFCAGTVVAYVINKFWTFKKKGYNPQEARKFVILYIGTMLVNVGVNTALVSYWHNILGAYLIATSASASINFLMQKLYVFPSRGGTLKKEFIPPHGVNRMRDEGNVEKARKNFLNNPGNNQRFLLENRYNWMNEYINKNAEGMEVGCGTGISKWYIKSKSFLITDYTNHPWLDVKNVDALHTPFDNESFDFIIASNMVHHVPYPLIFFEEMSRILKKGGVIIIQEINTSFFCRLMLRIMRHEGYSFDVNVFDKKMICTNPKDLWSANCAIPSLLFDNRKAFQEAVPNLRIIKDTYSEFFVLLNSGGVIAKTFYIPLPLLLLKVLKRIDGILVQYAPDIFAFQRQIVLKKSQYEE